MIWDGGEIIFTEFFQEAVYYSFRTGMIIHFQLLCQIWSTARRPGSASRATTNMGVWVGHEYMYLWFQLKPLEFILGLRAHLDWKASLGLHPGVTPFTYTQDSPHYSIYYRDVVYNLVRSPLYKHFGEITLSLNLSRVYHACIFSHCALLPEHGSFLGATAQKRRGKTGGPHGPRTDSHSHAGGPTLSLTSPTFPSATNFLPSLFLWVSLYHVCI